MKRLKKQPAETRKLYTATVESIYWHQNIKRLELSNIRCGNSEIDPNQLTIKIPPSTEQQIIDLNLKLKDRIEFVARYSFEHWCSTRKEEFKTQLNAPNKFRKLTTDAATKKTTPPQPPQRAD
jgi:hypothetical protein